MMSRYVAIVDLTRATDQPPNYKDLQNDLELLGFSTTIYGKKGEYTLPIGTFSIDTEGDDEGSEIMDLLRRQIKNVCLRLGYNKVGLVIILAAQIAWSLPDFELQPQEVT